MMTSFARRRSTVGATGLAVLLLAGGAVGCGGDKKDDGAGKVDASKSGEGTSPAMEPAAAVAKAAKNTADITSLRYRMTSTDPDDGKMTGEGAMKLKPLAMTMKMTSDDPEIEGPVEMRLVDNVMYMGSADLAKEMDGKSWMKFDLAALGKDGKNGIPGLDQLGSNPADQNPAEEASYLTSSKDVKKVGTETVEGVETTHYAGTVTIKDLLDAVKVKDKDVREQQEKSLKHYQDQGIDTMTMDMWIDGQDFTKQFQLKAKAKEGPVDMKITFLDYNKPVEVVAPPAKDTLDLAEMLDATEAS